MKQIISPLLQISLCTAGYLYASSSATLAQVTSDGTINTQVNQNGNVAEITGGETRGSNLFHSFQDFSVGTGNEAFFDNANDISNIFSRVTGGNISNIDGAIRANGSASLFLINPAGIIFGEGARLDIGGSFYGSSASSILFDDGEFSAVDLENPPLLTINAPIGLGFRDNPGDIVNRSNFAETTEFLDITEEAFNRVFSEISDELLLEIEERQFNGEESFPEILLDLGLISSDEIIVEEIIDPIGLQVKQGNNFALIGGNVSIETSAISGDQVTLGGLLKAGIVAFDQDGSFSFPEGIVRGDVSFSASSSLDFPFGFISQSNSNIEIYANSLKIDNGSISTFNNLLIDASESLIGRNSILDGNISIKAVDVTFTVDANSSFGGRISTPIPFFEEVTNNISIYASESVNLDNTGILTTARGDIDIITSNLNLNNGSLISTSASSFEGNGDGGTISINAIESVNISGSNPNVFGSPNLILSLVSQSDDPSLDTANNNGGDINISTPNLVLTDGGQIVTSTDGLGDAGNISINTDNLTIAGSGQILSNTSTQGKSGSISINASESISINGVNSDISSNGIFNQVEQDAEGIGGEINIATKDLRLTNGGQISAVTRGEGNAGNLNINTSNLDVQGINSGLFSRTAGSGNAGIVDIATSQLKVQDNAQVGVDNFVPVEFQIEQLDNGSTKLDNGSTRVIPIFNPVEGSGSAGTLQITADSIDLQSGGSLTAISAGGDGGNINLNSDLLTFRDGGNISATAGLEDTSGSGGNINIDSQLIIAFPQGNNDITANSFDGAGGNITISAKGIFGIEERPDSPLTNDITASSDAGISGSIVITTPDLNSVQGVTELPTNVVEPEETTQQACEANRELAAKNGLTISGKGGIPPEPGLPLNSLNVTINGEANPVSTIPALIETSQTEIQPARGIQITKSGEVILTAYRTNNSGDRILEGSVNCRRA